MAYLQERNGWYHIRWRSADGKQNSRALKTKDPKVAADMLDKLEIQHTLGRGIVGRVSFPKAWELFMEEHVATLAASTQENYKSTGKRFLTEWKNAPLDRIDRGTVQRYLNRQVKTLSRERIAVMRMMLSAFFKWAIMAGFVFYNPVKQTRKLKPNAKPIKTIKQEQASLLLAMTEPRWYPHVAMLYLEGLRIGELRGLTWDDFSTTKRWLRVRKTIYKQGLAAIAETDEPFSITKSKRGERLLHLSDLAYGILMEWKEHGWHRDTDNQWDLIFPSTQGNPLNDNTLREAITRAANRARKEWKGSEPFPKRVTPHTLRHGYCRMMLEAGIRMPELMILAGHSNLDQTRQYAEWDVGGDDYAAQLQNRLLGGSFGSKIP